MLNPDLKLNTKLFEEEFAQKATREGYGDALSELGDKNPDVVVLSADLTDSTKSGGFAKKFPERFFEVGVAEQNMAAIAAGLGVSGKIPFISSYATFSPGKNLETIRTTIAYNDSNVKIGGHHSGIMTGADGATHQATEDIAIMRSMPNMQVLVPCDAAEAKKATEAAANTKCPVYIRFTRDKTPQITTLDTPFEVGKIDKFWVSEKPQCVIFATGYMLYYALVAAKELEDEKIQVTVVNVASIKPLDTKSVIEFTKEAGCTVTVEDHQITGGLGGAIAETLAANFPAPIEFIGLQNTFAESGLPKELVEKYKMGTSSIKEAVKKVVKRKK